MIVSDDHHFVFLEVPRTGTTAIAAELVEAYGAAPIGPKHAHRKNAIELLGDRVRDYLWVAGVRHPMDDVVAEYEKVRSNHKGRYTDARRFVERGGSVRLGARDRHAFVQQNEGGFAAYFVRFHQRVHINSWVRDQRDADRLIRFESIQEGFAALLRSVGVEQVRRLPRTNQTEGKAGDFFDYYVPQVRRHAVAVLGPAMLEWNYTWPDNWEITDVPRACRAAYRIDRSLARGQDKNVGPAVRAGNRLRRYAVAFDDRLARS